jgi:hypothetical protein
VTFLCQFLPELFLEGEPGMIRANGDFHKGRTLILTC